MRAPPLAVDGCAGDALALRGMRRLLLAAGSPLGATALSKRLGASAKSKPLGASAPPNPRTDAGLPAMKEVKNARRTANWWGGSAGIEWPGGSSDGCKRCL